MINFITLNILRLYLYAILVFVFGSFAASSPLMIRSFSVLSTFAFFIWVLRQRIDKNFDSPNLIVNFIVFLFAWLGIQRLAALLGLPFFEVLYHWSVGIEFYQILWCGFVGLLISQHLLKTRKEMHGFIRFWIFSSAALGAFFIYLFYTSGVRVEALKLPAFFSYLGAQRFQPNNVIDLFIPSSFFALSIVFYNHRRKLSHADPSRAISEIVLYLILACVLMAAILYTRSRAGILAYGLGVLVFIVLFIFSHRKKRSVIKVVGLVLLLIIVLLSTFGMWEVFQELLTIKESLNLEIETIGTRSMGIGAAWQLVMAQGALGVGVGNFQMGWLLHHQAPFTSFPQVSFNDLLWFWAEMGFLGFSFFLMIVVAAIVKGILLIKTSESSYIAYLVASVIASMIAFLAHSCVDVTFYVAPLMVMFFLFIGLVLAFNNMEGIEVEEDMIVAKKKPRYHLSILIGLSLMGLALSYCSIQTFRAERIASKEDTPEAFIRASEIDQSSAYFPRKLNALYFSKYLDSGKEEDFLKAVSAIDEAIRRSPFSMIYYSKRAEMFLERQDFQGIQDSFNLANEYAPEFYLVDLAACAFYMNVSTELVNANMVERFHALALKHYANAVKLNPRLNKNAELYSMFNSEARQTFESLLEA